MQESSFLPNQNSSQTPKQAGQMPTQIPKAPSTQQPPAPVSPEIPIEKPKSGKFKLLIIAAVIIVVFLLGLGLSFNFIVSQIKKVIPTPAATATPVSQPVVEAGIKNPSRYATDSAVLKIKGDLDTLDQELNSVDLNENPLRPPNIQFDESF